MDSIIIDLDGTLTIDEPGRPYGELAPNLAVIERLREFKARGFRIVVQTARNMRSYNGSIGLINVHTLPPILEWLTEHQVPFDEVIVAKPWCGYNGFYVDDRAIRPDEFVKLDDQTIMKLLLPIR
jgi:capsule biosynthesis phosphatase